MSEIAGCLVALGGIFAAFAVGTGRSERLLRRAERRLPTDAVARSARRGRLRRPGRGLGLLVGAVAGLAIGGVVGLALGTAVVAVAIGAIARRRKARAVALRDEQLTDAVGSITAGLRSGMSIPQSLAYAASEAEDPLRPSLRSLVDSLDLGEPLDEALISWASSAPSDDGRLLAGVLRLHRRSGGDLPKVLDEVAATLRERVAATREIRALTAQARLSGAILGSLPIGFFGFLWLTSRRDIEGAFATPVGVGAIVVGLTLEAVAFLWIRHLLEAR